MLQWKLKRWVSTVGRQLSSNRKKMENLFSRYQNRNEFQTDEISAEEKNDCGKIVLCISFLTNCQFLFYYLEILLFFMTFGEFSYKNRRRLPKWGVVARENKSSRYTCSQQILLRILWKITGYLITQPPLRKSEQSIDTV